LTYTGRFTHISGHPSAAGRAQDSESTPVEDRRYTAGPRNQRLLWPSGWMEQDATWYEGRPRPYCVTWGSSFPHMWRSPPIFGPCLLWPNGRPSQLLLSTCGISEASVISA